MYVLPVLLYGAETWTLTKGLAASVDAFDQWCQRRILRVQYSDHVPNAEVRNRTGCVPTTEIIRSRRLTLFGHIARSESSMDDCRALRASISGVPASSKRSHGRPRHTWTQTVEDDLRPANIDLHALRGVEHRINLTGGHLLGQLRSSRGMLLMMMMMMMMMVFQGTRRNFVPIYTRVMGYHVIKN